MVVTLVVTLVGGFGSVMVATFLVCSQTSVYIDRFVFTSNKAIYLRKRHVVNVVNVVNALSINFPESVRPACSVLLRTFGRNTVYTVYKPTKPQVDGMISRQQMLSCSFTTVCICLRFQPRWVPYPSMRTELQRVHSPVASMI